MRITDWTVHTPDKNYHVFLEVNTDEGISGWGAAFSEKGQLLGALDWLKRFVVGENPLEIERVTEKLHEVTFWPGRGGAMTHAISGINLALWDITGKALKQPVHVLLGGAHRRAIRAYGSALFTPTSSLPKRIQELCDRGFRTIKLGWEPFGRQALAEDKKLVQLARKTAGDGIRLFIDAGGSGPFWGVRFKDALNHARMLADYDVALFEEPLAPDDIEGYRRLTDLSPVKIAHGEVLTRRQSFLPYFRQRAMDVVQPDVSKVGGLSEMRRIAWLAEEHGIELIPHGWNTAIGLAADVHIASTLATESFVEFNVGNPLVETTTLAAFRLDANGCLAVSDAPGLGVDVDRDRLKELEAAGYGSETWTWDEEKRFEARP